ncbi:NSFL1 cofactor p47 [Exaiptasia diaphana]|nr:NSFL1 cofactor p47 [Exaiptasia diaphana]
MVKMGWSVSENFLSATLTSHNVRSSSRIATMASYKAREHENDSDEEQGQAFYAGGSDTSGQQILGPSRSNKNSDIAQDIFEEAKRLVSKFNHDQTVGDVRAFITAARPQMAGTSFVLMTTFPNKELMSNQQTIQEANLLNAVIVQRLK